MVMMKVETKNERLIRQITYFNLLLPLLLLLFLYSSWVVARFELGHWPRPMFNDPDSISLSVSFLGSLAGWTMVLSPFAVLTNIASSVYLIAKRRLVRKELMVMEIWAVSGFVAAWCLMWWDPGRVWEWFFD